MPLPFSSPASSTPPRAWHVVLLFLAAFVFHLAGTWWLPLIDRDEPRFAEASREMLQRSDYVVPFFNNEYRFDKPPLTYWLQTTSYRILGENECAARLPSVLAAAGVAVILLLWGSRMRNAETGWKAAIIFTLSLQVAMHAKAAVADMLLVFFVCLAAWAGWEMLRQKEKIMENASPAAPWWWLFFGALALGFLAKGPIAWLPLIPVAAGLFRNPAPSTAPSPTRWLWFGLGLLAMIGAVALWGIPALRQTDGEFFKIGIGKHVVSRSVATMEGHGAKSALGYLGTLPFYFLTVFASFAPWSWFLPGLVLRWKSLWGNALSRHLLLYILLYFGVFSLVKTKLPHYTLPAFPMLALLLAETLPLARVRKIGSIMAGVLLTIALVVSPLIAHWFPAPSLARQSAPWLTRNMEFASIEFVEPSLVWSFRRYVDGFHSKIDPKKGARWMKKEGPRFYILPTAEVAGAFPALDPEWKVFHHRGLNFAKGERTDLTLLLKTR